MPRLKLTEANYYSQEADMQYMSASQFKSFRKCEAAAMAELRGEWGRKDTLALRVGSYVDAYFSGELEQYKAEHPEMFKKDGTLKADFVHAHKVAERLERDELARMLLSGRHQVIKIVKIGGVWFKTKADSLLTAAQVEAICKRFPQVRELVPFGGDIQGSIYQAADKRTSPFVIIGATKQDEPDIEAMYIPDDDLSYSLSEVEALSPRYDAIKKGEIEPVGCGKCAYCRSQKKLSGIKHYKRINEQEANPYG